MIATVVRSVIAYFFPPAPAPTLTSREWIESLKSRPDPAEVAAANRREALGIAKWVIERSERGWHWVEPERRARVTRLWLSKLDETELAACVLAGSVCLAQHLGGDRFPACLCATKRTSKNSGGGTSRNVRRSTGNGASTPSAVVSRRPPIARVGPPAAAPR